MDHLHPDLPRLSQSRQPDGDDDDACRDARDSAQPPIAHALRLGHRRCCQLRWCADGDWRPDGSALMEPGGGDGHQLLDVDGLALSGNMAAAHLVDSPSAARAHRQPMDLDALSWRRHQPARMATTGDALRGYRRTVVHPVVPFHHEAQSVPRRSLRAGRAVGCQRADEPQTHAGRRDDTASHTARTAVWRHPADALRHGHGAGRRCCPRVGHHPLAGAPRRVLLAERLDSGRDVCRHQQCARHLRHLHHLHGAA